MIIYFTGTGNSRYCAQFLADKLQDACVDAFPMIRQGAKTDLHSETPWVFVAPTYAWQAPRIFVQFLHDTMFCGNRLAYFILTCGGETGNAHEQLAQACREKGLCDQGLLSVIMPDNYLVMFPSPKPEEVKQKIEAARPNLEMAVEKILAGQPFPAKRPGALDKLKSGPVNEGMYRFFIKPSRFFSTDACVSCGKCQEVCPLGNISLTNGRPVWSNQCTHCMACLCGCPTGAIEYGKRTQGKARYQCPPYQG